MGPIPVQARCWLAPGEQQAPKESCCQPFRRKTIYLMNKYKVIYNACFGGFGLSDKALSLGRQLSGDPNWGDSVARHDPTLVSVVEQLGKEASGNYAALQIAEVSGPYRIDEYDGAESVTEPSDYTYIDPTE